MIKKLDIVKILQNLKDKDPFFISIDLDKYAQKLLTNAVIICEYDSSQLIGFAAFYANNTHAKKAYLSMLAVDATKQGRGIGSSLLKSSIEYLKRTGFYSFDLEVHKMNIHAIKLYENFNFKIFSETESSFLMSCNILIRENEQ